MTYKRFRELWEQAGCNKLFAGQTSLFSNPKTSEAMVAYANGDTRLFDEAHERFVAAKEEQRLRDKQLNFFNNYGSPIT